MYKLYKVVNRVSGREYIGMTKQTLDKRMSQHKDMAGKRNTPLYNAIESYGASEFSIHLLDEFNTREECGLAEIEKIASTDNLYNLAPGGTGGFVVQDIDSWKLKLSAARKGRKPALGMKHTEENKQKFSEVSRAYWDSMDTYNPDDILKHSHREAKELYGISTTHYYRLKRAGSNESS